MDTIQSTDIWAGMVKSICCSQQEESTKSGTEKTCYDCEYSGVADMNFEDILYCKQHNTCVTVEAPICSKFIEESWLNNVVKSDV